MSPALGTSPLPNQHSGAPVRITIGDPTALRRELLARVLSELGFVVTDSCSSADALVDSVGAAVPDIVLIDESLAGDHPLEVVQTVRKVAPGAAVVAMIASLSPEFALLASRAEVDGVIDGSWSAAQLGDGLHQIAAGHTLFPTGWLGLLRQANAGSLETQLSCRQLQVLALLSEGLTNAQIGEQLHISANTVKFHLRDIYRLVDVDNRFQAARYFSDHHERHFALDPASRPPTVFG